MRDLINEVKKKFNYKGLKTQSRPFISEDYVFTVSDFEAQDGFEIQHQEFTFLRDKIISIRDIFLSSGKGDKQIHLRLHLCWNGYQDALEILFKYILNFQRRVEIEAIQNTTSDHRVGDAGLYWSWEGGNYPDVYSFVRNNVFIAMTTSNSADLIDLAKTIDSKLSNLETVEEKKGLSSNYFDPIKNTRGEPVKLQIRGRLDIGSISVELETSFFTTTTGSMNRDQVEKEKWYFRAGNETGRHQIVHFGFKKGILPYIDRLNIEIANEGGEKAK